MNPYQNIVRAMQQLNQIIAAEPVGTIDSQTRQAWRHLKETLPCVSALMEEHQDGECYCNNRHDHGQTVVCPHCKVQHHFKP
jgi:hypothetical protein